MVHETPGYLRIYAIRPQSTKSRAVSFIQWYSVLYFLKLQQPTPSRNSAQLRNSSHTPLLLACPSIKYDRTASTPYSVRPSYWSSVKTQAEATENGCYFLSRRGHSSSVQNRRVVVFSVPFRRQPRIIMWKFNYDI